MCVVHFAGYPAAVRELRALCDAHGLALIEDVAHAPYASVDGRALGTFGLAGAFSFFSNKVLACGEGGLLATDDDEVAALARSPAQPGDDAGTWSRHTGETETYARSGSATTTASTSRASALLLSRLAQLRAGIARRRELTRAYRERLAGGQGVIVPYADEAVEHSTCYVHADPARGRDRRDEVRRELRDARRPDERLLSGRPRVHRLPRALRHAVLPRTEYVARAEITLPLFPDMDEAMHRPRRRRARGGLR